MTRRCEAILNARPTDWGFRPVLCSQVVGVHTVIDATGTVRGACSREGHRANVIRRFGRYVSEAELDAAHEASVAEMHELAAAEGLPDVPLAEWAPGELVEAWGK